ncbi:MAG: hypothetical protein JNL87_19560 [Burkholderiaceae bacterium]|nr:hypothetical protein [Burkholderiaceae bacterium]
MKPATVEVWVWVLIYGGLLLLCLGLFVARSDAALGWTTSVVGGLAAAVGVLLIYLRSRMRE